jgi:hypothetical protein
LLGRSALRDATIHAGAVAAFGEAEISRRFRTGLRGIRHVEVCGSGRACTGEKQNQQRNNLARN